MWSKEDYGKGVMDGCTPITDRSDNDEDTIIQH